MRGVQMGRQKLKIGKHLRTKRESAGFTQSYASVVMDIPRPAISLIENGKRELTAEELWDFSLLYQFDITCFFRELLREK
jgi:transcriptional regulator with XRE-family HTH domain